MEGPVKIDFLDLSVVKESERFDYWNEFLSKQFSRHHRFPQTKARFDGTVSATKFGLLNFVKIEASPFTSEVTNQIISSSGHKENYILVVPRTNRYRIQQDDSHGELQIGDMALLDTRLAGALSALETSDHILMSVPCRIWHEHAVEPNLGDNFIVSDDRMIARLIRGMILEMTSGPIDANADDQIKIAQNLIELISLAVAQSDDRLPASTHRQIFLRKVKLFVSGHLGDSSLGPATVASHFSVSTRYISKLFSQQGDTLMDYIRRLRLSKAAQLIEEIPQSGQSIKAISHIVGFKTHAHFSSTFSAEFGMSPKDYGVFKNTRTD